MVHFQILSVYPEIFSSFLSQGLIAKAIEEDRLEVDLVNFRKHGLGKHSKVDASPYGGGAGMVLRPEPIVASLDECQQAVAPMGLHKVLLSPQGAQFNQEKALALSRLNKPIALVCGRFEGFDERIRHFVDDEISLGDFIMMGGEVAAMAVIEAVSRLVPGIIGNEESLSQESFSQNLLEYSQYTRPAEFRGLKVPDVLTSGNHQEIEKWRMEDALLKTKRKRKDLIEVE